MNKCICVWSNCWTALVGRSTPLLNWHYLSVIQESSSPPASQKPMWSNQSLPLFLKPSVLAYQSRWQRGGNAPPAFYCSLRPHRVCIELGVMFLSFLKICDAWLGLERLQAKPAPLNHDFNVWKCIISKTQCREIVTLWQTEVFPHSEPKWCRTQNLNLNLYERESFGI